MIAAEQLSNLLGRAAANRVIKNPAAAPAAQTDLIDALAWLDWLEAKPGKNAERWSLRGSLYKRWAVCDPKRRRELLVQSAQIAA